MTLFILLPVGGLLGQSVPGLSESVGQYLNTGYLVFFILFGMSITLPTGKLWQTASQPTSILLAIFVSIVILPLVTWGVVLLFPLKAFSAGLLIMSAVPTTLASAAVWTRKAGGNDAIPLMATLLGNAFCFLTIPFWLGQTLGQSLPIDVWSLMSRLLIVAVLPMGLAQVLRAIPIIGKSADVHKLSIGMLSQIGILIIILVSAIRTGPIFQEQSENLSLLQVLLVIVLCGVIHGIGLWSGWGLTRLLKGSCEDAIGVAFSGSQKTLAIAIDLTTSPILLASGISPLAIIPPLIFHALQLIIDTIMIAKFRQTCSDIDPKQVPQPVHSTNAESISAD
nr:bile acid:sodium symporter [Rubinisphaera sp.]